MPPLAARSNARQCDYHRIGRFFIDLGRVNINDQIISAFNALFASCFANFS